jgi:thymidine kinase
LHKQLLSHLDTCLQQSIIIGVDEGQFFPDLLDFAQAFTSSGKTLIVAGLNGHFRRKPFRRILDLISRSESLTKLSAVWTVTGGGPIGEFWKICGDIGVGRELWP